MYTKTRPCHCSVCDAILKINSSTHKQGKKNLKAYKTYICLMWSYVEYIYVVYIYPVLNCRAEKRKVYVLYKYANVKHCFAQLGKSNSC